MADDEPILVEGKSLGELRVVDLKKELEARGLSKSGSKGQLISRLKAQLQLEKLQNVPVDTENKAPNLELQNDEVAGQSSFIKEYLARQQKALDMQIEAKKKLEEEERRKSTEDEGESETDEMQTAEKSASGEKPEIVPVQDVTSEHEKAEDTENAPATGEKEVEDMARRRSKKNNVEPNSPVDTNSIGDDEVSAKNSNEKAAKSRSPSPNNNRSSRSRRKLAEEHVTRQKLNQTPEPSKHTLKEEKRNGKEKEKTEEGSESKKKDGMETDEVGYDKKLTSDSKKDAPLHQPEPKLKDPEAVVEDNEEISPEVVKSKRNRWNKGPIEESKETPKKVSTPLPEKDVDKEEKESSSRPRRLNRFEEDKDKPVEKEIDKEDKHSKRSIRSSRDSLENVEVSTDTFTKESNITESEVSLKAKRSSKENLKTEEKSLEDKTEHSSRFTESKADSKSRDGNKSEKVEGKTPKSLLDESKENPRLEKSRSDTLTESKSKEKEYTSRRISRSKSSDSSDDNSKSRSRSRDRSRSGSRGRSPSSTSSSSSSSSSDSSDDETPVKKGPKGSVVSVKKNRHRSPSPEKSASPSPEPQPKAAKISVVTKSSPEKSEKKEETGSRIKDVNKDAQIPDKEKGERKEIKMEVDDVVSPTVDAIKKVEAKPKETYVPKLLRRRSLRTTEEEGTKKEEESGEPKEEEKKEKPVKKRKWGASKSAKKSTSLEISTESLKGLISDVIPPLLSTEPVLDLGGDNDVLSDKEEDKRDVKIRRTVLQVTSERTVEEKEKVLEVKNSDSEGEVNTEVKPAKEPKIIRRLNKVVQEPDEPTAARRSPSPPRNPVTNVVHIHNLVRPFTLGQLKELLKRSGEMEDDGFWINTIKSHCIAVYKTSESAEDARKNLHGTRWPPSNPKVLRVDFSTKEEFEEYKDSNETTDILRTKPVPHVHKEKERDREREKEREKERESRDKRKKEEKPIREWDRDKIRSRSRSRERREKERERRRRSRSAEREKRRRSRDTKEKDKKEKKVEEPPAKLLDDLFKKTKSTPCIYWLPLTEEQSASRLAARKARQLEREKRRQELDRQEELERKQRLNSGGSSGVGAIDSRKKERERGPPPPPPGRPRDRPKRSPSPHRDRPKRSPSPHRDRPAKSNSPRRQRPERRRSRSRSRGRR
ncbi:hypothetical protein SNE40_007286 [Patella caerulea]|uniref:SAP domain-containing protein n=1 Tax=Patella caerulea TaxID=87958 RepID=A0AAN8K5N0_PATCE